MLAKIKTQPIARIKTLLLYFDVFVVLFSMNARYRKLIFLVYSKIDF